MTTRNETAPWIDPDDVHDMECRVDGCDGYLSRREYYNSLESTAICRSCLEQGYEQCQNCGWHERDFVHLDRTRCGSSVLCHSCYDERITPCSECDEECRGRACRSCNTYDLCYFCMHAHHSHPYPQIHSYSYKPSPVFHGYGPLYLGVELEVDNGEVDRVLDYVWPHSDNEKLFYLKQDSSLGSRGVELVTHPLTAEFHRREFPWEDVLKDFIRIGYRSHNTTTCGMHIHASRDGLGKTAKAQDITINKLLILFQRHWEPIREISRRSPQALRQWSAPNHGQTESREYFLKELPDCKQAHPRYQAINLNPVDTIEFRLFRGSLRKDTVLATVQIVAAVIELCRSVGTSWIYYCEWDDILKYMNRHKEIASYISRMEERANRVHHSIEA